MKELRGSAINISFVEEEEGKYRALAEVVIVRSEPTYRVDDGGSLIRQRAVDEVRFATTAAGLRDMIKRFTDWADDMEDREKTLADMLGESASEVSPP